jgi:2-polyprenyl-3-methyl-5-hydroxy-6-metoxy-1,4-benzoquinol methylase
MMSIWRQYAAFRRTLSPMTESQRSYWTSRLSGGGIGRVGRIGQSDELNAACYKMVRRQALAMLRAEGVDVGGRALDVGTGWGFWFRTWHALGFCRVDAVDFVSEAVERVSAMAGADDDVRVADISQPGALEGREPYALVSCMNVLLHVVDDREFGIALDTVASAVAPGALLLLAEPAALGPVSPDGGGSVTSRVRPLADYRDPLRRAGLELVAVRPALAITGDPVETRPPLARWALRLWWRGVMKVDRVRGLRGPLAWVVEVVDGAARRFGLAETGKLLLFRRSSQAARAPAAGPRMGG